VCQWAANVKHSSTIQHLQQTATMILDKTSVTVEKLVECNLTDRPANPRHKIIYNEIKCWWTNISTQHPIILIILPDYTARGQTFFQPVAPVMDSMIDKKQLQLVAAAELLLLRLYNNTAHFTDVGRMVARVKFLCPGIQTTSCS